MPRRVSAAALLWLWAVALPIGGVESESPSPAREAISLVARFSTASMEVGKPPWADWQPRPLAPEVLQREKRQLLIPGGVRLSYPLEVAATTELVVAEVRVRGSATMRLEVTWTPAGEAERVLTRDLSAMPSRTVGLGNRSRQRGRLQLSVLGGDSGALVVVRDPRVTSRGSAPAAITAVPSGTVSVSAQAAGPNVIVYLIDALRSDHLGCYGYSRNVSPNIDRFAAGATVFDDAQAQSSWTRPAVASLFTGLWPQQHRTYDRDDMLPEQADTLAERLRAGGIATAAVVANGNVDRVYGMAQGFEYFKYLQEVRLGSVEASAEEVNQGVAVWLDQRDPSRPFFLYVHTIEPHIPYEPPEPFRSRFAALVRDRSIGTLESINLLNTQKSAVSPTVLRDLVDLYDAEIAANDAAFGALVTELKRRQLYETSVIVVLSDHGEELFDHSGFSHGNTLHAEVLDVPLLIRLPGRGPKRVQQTVGQVDLMPTLLELAGLEPPRSLVGHSLLPLLAPQPAEGRSSPTLAHLDLRGRKAASLVDGGWKLILRPRGDTTVTSLYDRGSDRLERHDLVAEQPEVAEKLRILLEKLTTTGERLEGETKPGEDEEVREQLKALGYL